jgi:hypothetical protein
MKALKTIVATAVIVFALTTVAMAGVQHLTQAQSVQAAASASNRATSHEAPVHHVHTVGADGSTSSHKAGIGDATHRATHQAAHRATHHAAHTAHHATGHHHAGHHDGSTGDHAGDGDHCGD